jgi:Domain of unknown function (DUF4331)
MRTRFLDAGWILCAAAAVLLAVPGLAVAADHGDANNIDNDRGADIADVFLFLDPNDNNRLILIGTTSGFIVPGEANNFGQFDDLVLYRFTIENTGDAKADQIIDIRFSPRTSTTAAQTAKIKLPDKRTFTAPTTPPTIAPTANPQVVTTDAETGIQFFAGIVDDPFFFDIPGFLRFSGSAAAGNINTAVLGRGRDTFAGYNCMGIAFSFPREMLRGAATNNVVGASLVTLRRTETPTKTGEKRATGKFRQVDRMANAGVNVALVPFARKTAYNGATPLDDARGEFANDIGALATQLGTNQTFLQMLADVAITRGDYVRVDLTKPNTGPGGGDNPGAVYPNGRRLKDDTIDITLTIFNNGTFLGDNVNASDIPPQNQFPFLALPHQPRDTGVLDDQTRN